MGKGANLVPDQVEESLNEELKTLKWSEIRENNWLVIDSLVYDVTNFRKKHPGGETIMNNSLGQDATVKFNHQILTILNVNYFFFEFKRMHLSHSTKI